MNQESLPIVEKPTIWQWLSIIGPSVCAVHCLAMPLIIAVLPIMGMKGLPLGLNEQVLALLVIPLCLMGLIPGYLRHRRKYVLYMMATGFSFIIFGSYWADSLLTNGAEVPFNLIGASILIVTSVTNYRLTHSHAHVHGACQAHQQNITCHK